MNEIEMEDRELQQRIIESADDYHFTAEELWQELIALEPNNEAAINEFRRMVRGALLYYLRAFLVLDMIETDDEQQLEDVLEIVAEQYADIADFLNKNNVVSVLDEESVYDFSRTFSVAEALRALLLEYSNHLATTVHKRFTIS